MKDAVLRHAHKNRLHIAADLDHRMIFPSAFQCERNQIVTLEQTQETAATKKNRDIERLELKGDRRCAGEIRLNG